LTILEHALIAVPSTAQLGSLSSILERHPPVLGLVLGIINQRLFLVSRFQNLLNKLINKSIDSSLIFLRLFSNTHPGFVLSDKLFRRFVRDILESHDSVLLSLVSGSNIVRKTDMFVIRCLSFLPLMLIAIANNSSFIPESFLKATPIWEFVCCRTLKTSATITSWGRFFVASSTDEFAGARWVEKYDEGRGERFRKGAQKLKLCRLLTPERPHG
jgi:hypothetical protein